MLTAIIAIPISIRANPIVAKPEYASPNPDAKLVTPAMQPTTGRFKPTPPHKLW